MNPFITAQDLCVSIGGRRILDDVTFQVEEGQTVGLVGPNGSGKTTLLRALAGTLPYEGSLRLHDREVSSWKPRPLARELAFLRQNTSLEFDFTVEQLVLLGRSPHKGWLEGYSAADREHIRSALDRVELLPFLNRSVLTLSGGELQRALLAQALVQEAPLLLLDEPTAHLDIHHQFEFMEIVAELAAASHTTITVFHDLELAARFAGSILVLESGRLVAGGTPRQVLTEKLISEVFRMRAAVEADDSDHVRIRFLNRSTTNGIPARQRS